MDVSIATGGLGGFTKGKVRNRVLFYSAFTHSVEINHSSWFRLISENKV